MTKPGATPERKLRKLCDRTRGKHAGANARLAANPHKPAVQTLLLANVSSLGDKMDYRLWNLSTQFKELLRFTESWQNENMMEV